MGKSSIQVPAPCHESWAAMRPTQGGRHCDACQQVVVDFTQRTDAEILAYFRQVTDGTCGQFRTDQVGRPLAARLAQPPRWWQPWLAGVLTSTLALQACDPIVRMPPRPPLTYTLNSLIDSAISLPVGIVPSDTAYPVHVLTDSLLDTHIVLGFTATPDADLK